MAYNDATNLFVYFSGNIENFGEKQRESLMNELFGQFGEVKKVAIIRDRESGELRNFCFVEMDSEAAQAAIAELHETTTDDGITLSVNVAKPREPRSGGSNNRGGGYNAGGYNNNRGGYNRNDYSGRSSW